MAVAFCNIGPLDSSLYKTILPNIGQNWGKPLYFDRAKAVIGPYYAKKYFMGLGPGTIIVS
jgi:hypothetical protein